MKKIISLLLLGFMMPLGASAEVDIFASTLLESSLTNMSTDLSEASQEDENDSVPPVFGKFTLKGVPGEGQDNKYNLYHVGKNKLEKGAVEEKKSMPTGLNKEIQLQIGLYAVLYEGSFMFIEIKEGKTLEVNLQRIDIDVTSKLLNYKVYRDFSSEEERLKLQKMIWIGPQIDSLLFFCAIYQSSKEAKEYCQLFLSEDFDTYSKTAEFNDKSEWTSLSIECGEYECELYWENMGREYITHASSSKKKETFVSVLPGDYKVEFTR